uniref:Uncharacterized protein n=1 Tax=Odontella aurita TaxID=265563 RepID=A0A7S4JSX7_9STRA|mmetsp:Transcript_53245/g.159405  ORF Transcript_53245/g.159405 Transcript_53245/m.159405 type:complete len:379 (+) Transcript_53245:90-1226(+)
MEHGLLLTKRPSSLAVGAAPASQEKVSIGNYKGVMLCNRPFSGGLDSTSKRQRQSSYASDPNKGDAFVCGTVAKPWGIGSNAAKTDEEKSRVISRLSKKDNALTKHKKWLKQMHEERERLEKERDEEIRIQEKRKREFMEKQAKVRSVVLEEAAQHSDDHRYMNAEEGSNDKYSQKPESASSAKPAWALTESAAKVVDDEAEAQEHDDLLTFVDDLDFERYSHDLELKVLIQQVKERIHALQKEKNIDEGRLRAVMDSELASIRANKYNSIREDGLNIIGDDRNMGSGLDDDIRSVAESVRSEGAVSCVHSQRSMEALVARSRNRIGDGGRLSSLEEDGQEEGVEPPKMVIHIEDEGARLAETKSLNKLPFKNRNPAL